MGLEHTYMLSINNSLKWCQGKKVLAWKEMDTKTMSTPVWTGASMSGQAVESCSGISSEGREGTDKPQPWDITALGVGFAPWCGQSLSCTEHTTNSCPRSPSWAFLAHIASLPHTTALLPGVYKASTAAWLMGRFAGPWLKGCSKDGRRALCLGMLPLLPTADFQRWPLLCSRSQWLVAAAALMQPGPSWISVSQEGYALFSCAVLYFSSTILPEAITNLYHHPHF